MILTSPPIERNPFTAKYLETMISFHLLGRYQQLLFT